jgi:serine/threonine-protein kinase
MAPEQTLGDGAVDARTDIYAVGILLFEMLTGRKPFVSENLAELILMHQTQPPPRMSTAGGGASFSDALEALVAKALAKAPADRFSTADEMAAALEQVPESPAMRAGARAVAADLDKTIIDKTIIDKTMVQPGSAPQPPASAPHRPQQGRAPAWYLRMHWKHWRPVLRPFWKRWTTRRRRLLLGASTSVALIAVISGALLVGRRRPRQTNAPAPAPTAALAPAPTAMDELAPLAPDSTPGLADAAQLVRLGLRDQAITVLQDIRRSYPRSAYANFLLAVVYFEKLWWSVGVQHAQAAMQADPLYRRSPKLARLIVHALVSDAIWERAADFLVQEMAEFSIPYLEEAAQFDKSARVRARASQILSTGAMRASATGGRR